MCVYKKGGERNCALKTRQLCLSAFKFSLLKPPTSKHYTQKLSFSYENDDEDKLDLMLMKRFQFLILYEDNCK